MKEEYDSKRSSHKESYLGSRPSTGFSYFMFIFCNNIWLYTFYSIIHRTNIVSITAAEQDLK